VEVGQTVDIGQPLATSMRSTEAAGRAGVAEFTAATGVLAQAAAAEQRAKDLKVKGWTTDAQLDTARAAAMKPVRASIAPNARRSDQNSLSYATLPADARGVVTATLIEPARS